MDEKQETGAASAAQETVFAIMFRAKAGERLARIVIESLRTFGGALRDCEVWVFVLDPARTPHVLHDIDRVLKIPLALQDGDPAYLFAEKVYACARAEDLAGPDVRSLVWLGLDCLIINPPLLFALGPESGVAPECITVELTEAARKWLAREGYDPAFGARPLRRTLQRYLESPLSKRILRGEMEAGEHVLAKVNEAVGELWTMEDYINNCRTENMKAEPLRTLPGLSDFFMAGQWVTPGGGVLPCLYTGRHAVQLLCRRDGRPCTAATP